MPIWSIFLIYLSICLSIFHLILYLPLYLADLSDPPTCLTDEHLANLQGTCQKIGVELTNMQQLCETSSRNESCRAESKATLRGFLHFGAAGCTTCGSVPLLLAIFHLKCWKFCACHEKLKPSHRKCCTCHAKWSSKIQKIRSSKMQPLSLQSVENAGFCYVCNVPISFRLPCKTQCPRMR